jgi:D-cysteine desulfhydrase/L-cysteate sulfo-lyase
VLSRPGYSTEPQGNLLLDYVVGAKVEFSDARIGPELDTVLTNKAEELRKLGRKPYAWHRPRVVPLAAVSYAGCVAEIVDQVGDPAAIYVSSSGATGAGVALGAKLLSLRAAVKLICPMTWPWSIPESLANDANAAAAMIGLGPQLTAAEIDADESLIAPGYGKPSPEGREALHLLATTEAILLDPVYSAKAMAGLIRDVRAGRYAEGSTIVFIHTGGIPAIFSDPGSVM